MSQRLLAILRTLQNRIESAVYDALKSGKSADEVNAIVTQILDESNFSNMFAADLRVSATAAVQEAISRGEAKHNWILTHTQQDKAKKEVGLLALKSAVRVVRSEDKMRKTVIRKIADGLTSGRSTADIVNDVVETTGQLRTIAKTWENTTRAGFQTQSNISVATQAGVENFTLVGDSPQRQWCKKFFGETHPLSFWKRQDNGQGLPVVPHCGGYNCNHTLEAEIE